MSHADELTCLTKRLVPKMPSCSHGEPSLSHIVVVCILARLCGGGGVETVVDLFFPLSFMFGGIHLFFGWRTVWTRNDMNIVAAQKKTTGICKVIIFTPGVIEFLNDERSVIRKIPCCKHDGDYLRPSESGRLRGFSRRGSKNHQITSGRHFVNSINFAVLYGQFNAVWFQAT